MNKIITKHIIYFSKSGKMTKIKNESVDLVVTSPPYPMIKMWDKIFCRQNPEISKELEAYKPYKAFELMHKCLDLVWNEVFRVLKPGAIVCINIGDATRTINENFALFCNHSRVLQYMLSLGFRALPAILWRKQTNAPNKFMGSGMMPPGAYVTLEHEYILILRKGRKREFKSPEEKKIRRESAYFWEERNTWFSDVWMDLKGTRQYMTNKKARKRNGAFPFELAYRLINMFSVKQDIVLDPFLGTGTTTRAAMASARSSIGFEMEKDMRHIIFEDMGKIIPFAQSRINKRFSDHLDFTNKRQAQGKKIKHTNIHYGFPVITAQEKDLLLHKPESMNFVKKNHIKMTHCPAMTGYRQLSLI